MYLTRRRATAAEAVIRGILRPTGWLFTPQENARFVSLAQLANYTLERAKFTIEIIFKLKCTAPEKRCPTTTTSIRSAPLGVRVIRAACCCVVHALQQLHASTGAGNWAGRFLEGGWRFAKSMQMQIAPSKQRVVVAWGMLVNDRAIQPPPPPPHHFHVIFMYIIRHGRCEACAIYEWLSRGQINERFINGVCACLYVIRDAAACPRPQCIIDLLSTTTTTTSAIVSGMTDGTHT